MRRFLSVMLFVFGAVAFVGCGHDEGGLDGLKRSKVDALNKASFKVRFDNARLGERYARRALQYIDDSLPTYDDGRLRSWNNLAMSYFNRSIHDTADMYADSVLNFGRKTRNGEIERVLAKLLKARLLQRKCDIAESYQILYDTEQSGLLDGKGEGWLYNLARSEFYITTTTLNYHYRNKSQYQQTELLTEMENRRGELQCDYQEDMSLNYAIAYGYHALCADTAEQSEYVAKVLSYCAENFRLLSDSTRYSTYHLANTYQLLGFLLWNGNVRETSLDANNDRLTEICNLVYDAFGFDAYAGDTAADAAVNYTRLAYSFLKEATALFFEHEDAYQRLGSVVATGRFCMAHGDTVRARNYFKEALLDSSMLGVAPKFEAMLYEGFLTSGCAETLDEVADWTRHELQLLAYITRNEKADFLLQQQLNKARHNSVAYMVFALVLSVLAVALLVTLLLLHRRTKALQRETSRLQEAKRQDVERIANVETCLSVLRHDITPFISYLQNDSLPEELKREVTSQLIRTFENIKSWTNLSIPSGLQFNPSRVPLQEVFDTVGTTTGNFKGLEIVYHPTEMAVVGDRQLIEIMLRNLVNNAIQHTEQGRIDISARESEDSRFVEVCVRDTGSGMDEETIENLFRADKKIKPSSEHGYGTGFGLILCRYIIKKHDDNTLRGCRIWAEGKVGEGSVFRFVLQKINN